MKTIVLMSLSLFILLQSCKKGDDVVTPPVVTPPIVTPPPVVPGQEILSTGWSKQYIGTPSTLDDIFFNSPTNGYAIGSGIYKTVDGGISWVKVNTASTIYNMFMTPDNKAFFINRNSVLKTLDGGIQFSELPLDPVNATGDIFFIDNNAGYCTTSQGLYNTINGGTSWSKLVTTGLTMEAPNYPALFFFNNSIGWIASGKKVYKAAGSFLNWQEATLPGGIIGRFTAIYGTSAQIVYAATDKREIYKSTDGGTNFSFLKKLSGEDFTDLHFINDNVGYSSSVNEIYKTVDGGVNWTLVVAVNKRIIELHFADATHGWAVGDSGMVLRFKP